MQSLPHMVHRLSQHSRSGLVGNSCVVGVDQQVVDHEAAYFDSVVEAKVGFQSQSVEGGD